MNSALQVIICTMWEDNDLYNKIKEEETKTKNKYLTELITLADQRIKGETMFQSCENLRKIFNQDGHFKKQNLQQEYRTDENESPRASLRRLGGQP